MLGPALLAEYEDVPGHTELFADSVLSTRERGEVFDGLMNRCRWGALAKSNSISINKLMDELATVALANDDARVRFETFAPTR